MIDSYPITPDFRAQRPLQEGDQAIVDAIEQIEPGKRGYDSFFLIERGPAHRPAGTFGEVVFGRVLTDIGEQETVFVDVQPRGILAGIDTREPGSNTKGADQIGAFGSSPGAQAIKLEAARRLALANKYAH